jgi:hypothetical protein
MKIVVALSLLVLFAPVTSRAQQVEATDIESTPALFALFVSCDLVSQFVTPAIDEKAVIRLESPVSREGARMLEQSRRYHAEVRAPVLLKDTETARRVESAPVARFDAASEGACMHLIMMNHSDLDSPVEAALPARTDPSTWVRIRALYGR